MLDCQATAFQGFGKSVRKKIIFVFTMEMKGIYNANGIETTHIGMLGHPDASQQLARIPAVNGVSQ